MEKYASVRRIMAKIAADGKQPASAGIGRYQDNLIGEPNFAKSYFGQLGKNRYDALKSGQAAGFYPEVPYEDPVVSQAALNNARAVQALRSACQFAPHGTAPHTTYANELIEQGKANQKRYLETGKVPAMKERPILTPDFQKIWDNMTPVEKQEFINAANSQASAQRPAGTVRG